MNTSQPQVSITDGDYCAEISLRGGELMSLRHQGRNLVLPTAQLQGASAATVLAPWPSPTSETPYEAEGTEYTLPDSEEQTGAAAHGLLHEVDLEVLTHNDEALHLQGSIPATEGHLFPLDIVIAYRFAPNMGLSCTLMVRYSPHDQQAAATAPFGAGFRPWLTADNAPIQQCRLRLPARTVINTDTNGTIQDRRPPAGDLDLTDAPLLANRRIEHTYTDLPEQGWTAELIHEPSETMVRMISDAPWAQVYADESIQGSGIVVAPMSCPPHAFSSTENLIHLQPGHWKRFGYSIEASYTGKDK